MSKIFEIYGSDAHKMTVALMEAANVADMIPKGGSVALKPNLVVAGRPEDGATTHAGVLSGCMEYLQKHGFTNISVIEGSWVGDDTGRAFRMAGYDKVCKEYGVPYYDLKRDKTRTVKTAMRSMEICCRALDTDFLINLPVLKGHCQTVMTCALKNCKGCLPDKEKRRFHSEGLHKPIAALGAYLKPQLTIVDSICGDLNFEEGGNPVRRGQVLGFRDPVLCDAWACREMGYDLDEVPYVGLAAALGVGSADLEAARVTEVNRPEAVARPPKPARRVAALSRCVREQEACSACYASLICALERLDGEGVPTPREVCIGQGFRGKAGDVGVGACTAGFAHSVGGCPPRAADVLAFLRGLR